VNLGNAEENRLFVAKSDKKYFATAYDIHPEIENNSLSYIVKDVMNNSTVLDVGCSYGYLCEWLAKCVLRFNWTQNMEVILEGE
jgi:2-polyprenyl-3-methyl-5-hydroxy-6-metoxy-1,4-benzoquinol methylase